MTFRKGDFYIIKKGFVPQKVSGYIVDEKIGFCRNESGEFYPTDIKSGMCLPIPRWRESCNAAPNLLNVYKAYKEFYCDDHAGLLIDENMRDPDAFVKKCIETIKKAYKADKETL